MVQNGSGAALVRSDLAGLSLATWWQDGRSLPNARGRGRVVVLEPAEGIAVVARTYRRGGALRCLLGDRYLRAGRAFAELALLAELVRRGIPAVEPVAAVARRRGVIVRLRLVTALVPDARVLTDFLVIHPHLHRHAVEEAGRVVRKAFDAGLVHPDLHPENLLAQETGDGVRVLLMDLDRARLVPSLGEEGRDRMLVRMARYLHRHEGRLELRPGSVDQLRFLRGMGLGRAQRRSAVCRLAPALARSVAIHRLSWGSRRPAPRPGETD